MRQEIGETTEEMIRTDDQMVQDILNQRPTGHYWVVIHHKPTNFRLKSGERVIAKVIKDYDSEPPEMIGTVILEIRDGQVIGHRIRPHDAPIDWEKVVPLAGSEVEPMTARAPGYVYTR